MIGLFMDWVKFMQMYDFSAVIAKSQAVKHRHSQLFARFQLRCISSGGDVKNEKKIQ
jgi:hypothetical protein